jgi:hypothetical protein
MQDRHSVGLLIATCSILYAACAGAATAEAQTRGEEDDT